MTLLVSSHAGRVHRDLQTHTHNQCDTHTEREVQTPPPVTSASTSVEVWSLYRRPSSSHWSCMSGSPVWWQGEVAAGGGLYEPIVMEGDFWDGQSLALWEKTALRQKLPSIGARGVNYPTLGLLVPLNTGQECLFMAKVYTNVQHWNPSLLYTTSDKALAQASGID